MTQQLIFMSKDEVLQKLAEITGKAKELSYVENQRVDASEDIDNNEEKAVDDIAEARSNTTERSSENSTTSATSSLEDLQKIFGGNIVNKYLMDTRQMTRKEYIHYTKGLKRSELMDHPLLYLMFRSEDQAQVNFFDWINRFKL
jgi:hypothetical protein